MSEYVLNSETIPHGPHLWRPGEREGWSSCRLHALFPSASDGCLLLASLSPGHSTCVGVGALQALLRLFWWLSSSSCSRAVGTPLTHACCWTFPRTRNLHQGNRSAPPAQCPTWCLGLASPCIKTASLEFTSSSARPKSYLFSAPQSGILLFPIFSMYFKASIISTKFLRFEAFESLVLKFPFLLLQLSHSLNSLDCTHLHPTSSLLHEHAHTISLAFLPVPPPLSVLLAAALGARWEPQHRLCAPGHTTAHREWRWLRRAWRKSWSSGPAVPHSLSHSTSWCQPPVPVGARFLPCHLHMVHTPLSVHPVWDPLELCPRGLEAKVGKVERRLDEVEGAYCGADHPCSSPFPPTSQGLEKFGHTEHRTLMYLLVN